MRNKVLVLNALVLLVACILSLGLAQAYDEFYGEPYVNPLGNMDAYDSIDYLDISDQYDPWFVEYYISDEDNQTLELWGNVWILTVPNNTLDDLHDYLQNLDSNILFHTEERLIAKVEGPGEVWWVHGEYWGDDWYDLTLVQERRPLTRGDELPLPLISPLGDPAEYSWFDYMPSDRIEIGYFTAEGEATSYYGWGDTWRMTIEPDDSSVAMDNLAQYIRELGGEVKELSPFMLTGTVLDEDSYMWSAFAQIEEDGTYFLTVTRERWLVPGHTWEIRPDEHGDVLGFGFSSDGEFFHSLIVELEQGEVGLFEDMVTTMGEYHRSWSEWRKLEFIKTPLHIIDHFPQEAGKLTWVFDWSQDPRPEKISVSIAKSVPLPKVTLGRELGILKITGASMGEVSVESTWNVGIAHPDFQYAVGDINSDGDHVFYLPSGYWNFTQHEVGFAPIKGNMIPVNAGQITVYSVPSMTQAVFEEITDSTEMGETLNLTSATVGGTQGVIEFALIGEETKSLVPTVSNAQITEGGLPGQVLAIEPIATPPSIVLLLDSSGSMRSQMEQTIVAAKRFVNELSDDTFIRVIDFSTKPEVLPGTTKQEVLASLDQVRASGATALYDSVLAGLELLQEKTRPVLVVFTDGVDANYDDTGPGSVATLPEVTKAIAASGVPLYTIGFGSGHDATALKQMATTSGGRYYAATDQNALEKVFTAINDTLSNTYRLVYQRPTEPSISNVPVVSIMVDTSGSMDESPEEEGCGYRMQKVKNVLHEFVLGLPENTLLQVQDFSWGTIIQQSMTMDKAAALYAIGAFEAAGATDTLGSVEVSYQTLSRTPSQNKVLIYITDIAIATDDSRLNWLFELIAKSDIKPVWIGIGMEDDEAIFADIAKKSNGRHLVTEDPNDLATLFEQVLAEIKVEAETSSYVTLQLSIKEMLAEEAPRTHFGSMNMEKTKLAQSDDVIGPEVASYYAAGTAATAEELRLYGLEGEALHGQSLQTRFVPLDASASNTALSMKVTGATIANYLQGLRAPNGAHYVTIDLELENILEAQEVIVDTSGNSHPANWMSTAGSSGRTEYMIPQYLIPSLASHLYVGWNNSSMFPVSEVSWLDPEGLLVPGDMSLTVHPGEPMKGRLSFIVTDESMTQLSLHFFDTAYGHFNLDLVGTSEFPQLELTGYPEAEPAKLSDVFQLKIVGVEDRTEIGSSEAKEGSVFRVVDLELTSKVQALLDIDPTEVFWLTLWTDQGAFFVPLHELTALVPLGFSEGRMVAPGSYNRVRFVYEIPEALVQHRSELYVDLRDDDVIIPLNEEPPLTTSLEGDYVEAEGVKLYINQVAWMDGPNSTYDHLVVADVTFVDEPDDVGTSMDDVLTLVRDDYSGSRSEFDMKKLVTQSGLGDFSESGEVYYELLPSAETDKLLLGLSEAVVKDGTSRRALVVFEIPKDGLDHGWTLQSGIFPDLQVELSDAFYTDPDLLMAKTEYVLSSDEAFEEELSGAIAAAIRRYEALQAAQGSVKGKDRVDLSGTDDAQRTITPPLASAPGLVKLEALNSPDKLWALLQEVRWLPGDEGPWQPIYAPEAVLTQMWGTPADLACLAESVLERLGYSPERAVVEVTANGQELLLPEGPALEMLPAVKYEENGQVQLVVLPFAKDVAELEDYVSIPIRRISISEELKQARVQVHLNVVAKGAGFGGQFADFASVLSGEEAEEVAEPLTVLSTTLSWADLSLDPIDVVYVSAGYNMGELFTAIMETPTGRVVGHETVDTGEYEIKGATIEVVIDDAVYVHEFILQKDQRIDQVAHTVAINAPDLPPESAEALQAMADTLHGSTDNPDSLSVLQWYTRSIINQFIAAQTENETDLAEQMDLVVGRTTIPRIIAVTVKRSPKGDGLHTSIDLVNASNQVHGGDPELQNSFYIASGIMASTLESQVLGQGTGVFELWSQLPEDAGMLWINEETLDDALEILEEAGFDEAVRRRIGNRERIRDKVLMMPLERVMLDGVPRTAWLEIDEETFFTIGVLDTGEHGAMIEKAIMELYKSLGKYSVGALVGVESMLWGVSSYALVYDEYEDVLNAAAAQSYALAEQIKKGLELHAKLSPDYFKSLTPQAMAKGKLKKLFLPDISFTSGMAAGIEYYLHVARQ